jgi:hypothetical protein
VIKDESNAVFIYIFLSIIKITFMKGKLIRTKSTLVMSFLLIKDPLLSSSTLVREEIVEAEATTTASHIHATSRKQWWAK